MFKFLQRWFLNGTPETSTAILNLWVPTFIWQRFTYDFRRDFPGWSKWRLQIFRYKKQLYGLFWKSESACRKLGTKQCRSITLTCINTATMRQAAVYFELSKSSTLKRGMDASSFLSFFWVISIFLASLDLLISSWKTEKVVSDGSGRWRSFKTSNSVMSLFIFNILAVIQAST